MALEQTEQKEAQDSGGRNRGQDTGWLSERNAQQEQRTGIMHVIDEALTCSAASSGRSGTRAPCSGPWTAPSGLPTEDNQQWVISRRTP